MDIAIQPKMDTAIPAFPNSGSKNSCFGVLIEEGSFAHVYRRALDDGLEYAIKVFKKKKQKPGDDVRMFTREVRMMKRIGRHPCIVEIFEQGIYGNDTLCIAMEYCAIGDLYDFVHRGHQVTENTKTQIIKQISGGLEHIHGMKMIHNDIKMENIFVSHYNENTGNIRVKIGDFGLATIGYDTKGYLGTYFFMSPEHRTMMFRTYKTDIWAFGIVTYMLYFKQHPLCGKMDITVKQMYDMLINYKDHSVFEQKLYDDKSVQSLINYMLTKSYIDRPSATMILEHAYLN